MRIVTLLILVLILSPFYVALTWLVYAGATWAAALFFTTALDQAAAGALATVVIMGAVFVLLYAMERKT